MRVVIDASVAIKWLFPDPIVEPDADRAIEILRGVGSGDIEPLQPPHWLFEVAAVVTRLRPEMAEQAVDMLDAMELSQADGPEVVRRAVSIAAHLKHHLFDTLYHAVALEHGAVLVTADRRYYRKSCQLGSIVELADWR